MDLLVVGANGLLGSNVVRDGRHRGWDVYGTYHSAQPDFDIPLHQFDLQQTDAFDAILDDVEPDVVVNCAAMTDVDECEARPEKAHAINADAPGALAARCEASGCAFVHVSTDYVFDGSRREPYDETAPTNPIQVYGESKHAGEQAVRDATTEWLVTRLSFVYGIHRSTRELTGFPAWVHTQLESGEEVPLFTDQWVTPTRAGQAAETLLDLVSQEHTGLYHVAARSCVTPYEFGDALATKAGADEDLLEEGTTDAVDRPAPRPSYTCLDVGKVESTLGRSQPTLRDDLEAIVDVL